MKTFLHGENIVESRNELQNIRTQHKGEIINLNGKNVALTELKQALESMSLFGQDRLVIIENLISRQSKTQLKEVIDYITSEKTSVNIVIWEGKEVGKILLRKFTSWDIQLFKIPKVLFTFLDSITPGNAQRMLELLINSRKSNEDMFIFLMIVRQIRLLLLAKDRGLTGMPPWIAGKISRQSSSFSKEQLINLYKKLLLIDIGQKTGKASFNLNQELDLFVATL